MASLLKGFFGEPGDFYEEGAPAYPDHTEAVREARPYKDLLFEESGRPWEGEYVVRRMPSQELVMRLSWSTTSYNGGAHIKVEYGGDAWLALGVSADGHMVGGGRSPSWHFWRWSAAIPSPAVVASWSAPDAPSASRYKLRGYSLPWVRFQSTDAGTRKGAVNLTRADGVSAMQMVMPYSDECGPHPGGAPRSVPFAVCIGMPTKLIMAHGARDDWKTMHAPDAVHSLDIKIHPKDFREYSREDTLHHQGMHDFRHISEPHKAAVASPPTAHPIAVGASVGAGAALLGLVPLLLARRCAHVGVRSPARSRRPRGAQGAKVGTAST